MLSRRNNSSQSTRHTEHAKGRMTQYTCNTSQTISLDLLEYIKKIQI